MSDIYERLTYKPGWEFRLTKTDLLVLGDFPASSGKDARVRVNKRIKNVDDMTDAQLITAIFETIMWLEAHEVLEFFRLDGKPVLDPHPELRRVPYHRLGQHVRGHHPLLHPEHHGRQTGG